MSTSSDVQLVSDTPVDLNQALLALKQDIRNNMDIASNSAKVAEGAIHVRLTRNTHRVRSEVIVMFASKNVPASAVRFDNPDLPLESPAILPSSLATADTAEMSTVNTPPVEMDTIDPPKQ